MDSVYLQLCFSLIPCTLIAYRLFGLVNGICVYMCSLRLCIHLLLSIIFHSYDTQFYVTFSIRTTELRHSKIYCIGISCFWWLLFYWVVKKFYILVWNQYSWMIAATWIFRLFSDQFKTNKNILNNNENKSNSMNKKWCAFV